MSYKHNNLFAMRQSYWDDQHSSHVIAEKKFLCDLLDQYGVFKNTSLADAEYFFFTLPSIIIVKGYALGFMHPTVQKMIEQHIAAHLKQLQMREAFKVSYRTS